MPPLPVPTDKDGHRTGKGQFSFQSQRRAMPKNAGLQEGRVEPQVGKLLPASSSLR